MTKYFILAVLATNALHANPYPDPSAVPQDGPYVVEPKTLEELEAKELQKAGHEILRVEVAWQESSDSYEIASVKREPSGTDALLRRSRVPDPLGSYQGTLRTAGGFVAYDSLGTGRAFRKLTRALTFRFPMPFGRAEFALVAENPTTGAMEEVLRQNLEPPFDAAPALPTDFEVRLVEAAAQTPSLVVNIYAEGYYSAKKDQFWKDARRVVDSLKSNQFPGREQMTFQAVFASSAEKLGSAEDLGLPVAERNSFLSLYFPYWNPFGRWYHVVYPTRESRYRAAIGGIPYDYPIAIIDNSGYWGVGNFNELTAIPSSNGSFTYLLLHELGHYFGLNEEYEGGGPTELEFAPHIHEPWSQNITFLKDTLKWKSLIAASTPVPTPSSAWTGSGPFGAYKGGYADSHPTGKSHKPGHNCIMKNGSKFCPICKHAIEAKVRHDLGN